MFTKHTIGILRYTTVKHPHLANQVLPQTNSVYTMTASCWIIMLGSRDEWWIILWFKCVWDQLQQVYGRL